VPLDAEAAWKWHTYQDVFDLASHYMRELQGCARFVVANFPCNCIELVALDVASALLGLCCIVVHGAEQVQHILKTVGTQNCKVVCRPPENRNESAIITWQGDDTEVFFTLFCTSGSTGLPKLVKRSRAGWVAIVRDTVQFGAHLCITMIFGSLAHSGPRTELWWNLACGGQTAFYNDKAPLLAGFAALSPTELAAPPLIWAEFRQECHTRGIRTPRDMKKELPGLVRRLQSVSTGSARCDKSLLTFLHTVFDKGVLISDNYGATEVGAIATDGVINFNVEARLVDVPELGFCFPFGEICVRCLDAFEGYFGDATSTETAMTPDGFYRTGDIGEQIGHGEIRIVDRCANFVKLANGKFCSLEAVENEVLMAHAMIQQACAVEHEGGVAVLIYAPDLDDPMPHFGFPCVRSVDKFTVANGMLTPSLKNCRRIVAQRNADALKALPCSSNILERLIADLCTQNSTGIIDNEVSLASLGMNSVQSARIAAELGVSVHAVASAKSVQNLRCLCSATKSHDSWCELAHHDLKRWHAKLSQANDGAAAAAGGVCHQQHSRKWSTVLVTGASGRIGSNFVSILEIHGLQVIQATRSLGYDFSKQCFGLPNDVYCKLKAECDAVIHCAAVVNWSACYESVRDSNIDGTAHVVQFCMGTETSHAKPLLFIGSGADFPEHPAEATWIEECLSPYMASKAVAECIVHGFCRHAVTVRPGLVVWHSQTGQYNSTDAMSRICSSFATLGAAWDVEDAADGILDGINVDSFCNAAWAAFTRGGPAVYNMRGTFALSDLLRAYPTPLVRLPYSEWRHVVEQRCRADPTDPLVGLLPHIDDTVPPLTAPFKSTLSAHCTEAIGASMAESHMQVAGFDQFVKKLLECQE